MNPQENIAYIEDAKEQIRQHPMCGSFEDRGDWFQVIYPAGYCRDGILAATSSGISKAKALDCLIEAMERDWKRSFPAA